MEHPREEKSEHLKIKKIKLDPNNDDENSNSNGDNASSKSPVQTRGQNQNIEHVLKPKTDDEVPDPEVKGTTSEKSLKSAKASGTVEEDTANNDLPKQKNDGISDNAGTVSPSPEENVAAEGSSNGPNPVQGAGNVPNRGADDPTNVVANLDAPSSSEDETDKTLRELVAEIECSLKRMKNFTEPLSDVLMKLLNPETFAEEKRKQTKIIKMVCIAKNRVEALSNVHTAATKSLWYMNELKDVVTLMHRIEHAELTGDVDGSDTDE